MKKFPIGLTIATAIAFAILCGLGGWQLKRLAWKNDLLARIEALNTAPARPLATVLALAAKGGDVDFARVKATCLPTNAAPSKVYLYGLTDGRPVWRHLAPCFADGSLIIIDRGFADGPPATRPPRSAPPPPRSVVGILRKPEPLSAMQQAATYAENDDIGWQLRQHAMLAATPEGAVASAYILVVEAETPRPAGLTAAPLPTDIANRHLEYALTWFGLAGALAAVYAALVRRRMKT